MRPVKSFKDSSFEPIASFGHPLNLIGPSDHVGGDALDFDLREVPVEMLPKRSESAPLRIKEPIASVVKRSE